MAKRGFKFGTYDTAEKGWTLTSWEFTEPELIENYITVPGRLDGPIDASTALTNGDPRYGTRKLTATFECSEDTRAERETLIIKMRISLDGLKCEEIRFPDLVSYYATGRIRVEKLYNDLAHASVRVTAICEPWLYFEGTRVFPLTAEANETLSEEITNKGRRRVTPTIDVLEGSVGLSGTGDGGLLGEDYAHTLGYISLSTGTYQLPDFYLLPYEKFTLTYSGACRIRLLLYGEAIL